LREANCEVFKEVLLSASSTSHELLFCLFLTLISLHEFEDKVEVFESNLPSILLLYSFEKLFDINIFLRKPGSEILLEFFSGDITSVFIIYFLELLDEKLFSLIHEFLSFLS